MSFSSLTCGFSPQVCHSIQVWHKTNTEREKSCLLSCEIQVATDFPLYLTAPLHGFPSLFVAGRVKTDKNQTFPSYSMSALPQESVKQAREPSGKKGLFSAACKRRENCKKDLEDLHESISHAICRWYSCVNPETRSFTLVQGVIFKIKAWLKVSGRFG